MGEQVKNNTVIKVPRHFSGEAVKEVVDLVHNALSAGADKLTFDFFNAESVDSFGIGQLVSLAKELKDDGIFLTLSNLNDDLFQLFVDTGLDQIFAIEGVKQSVIDLFESSVDIRLDMTFEEVNDVCIFKMSGIMDNVGGSRFFRQKFLLSLARYRKIHLEMNELTFFDSLSVSALIDMHKLLKETGGSMRICGANYIVEDLFTTLNINAIIPIFDNREGALVGWN
jgi:anti-anti-sigma factor